MLTAVRCMLSKLVSPLWRTGEVDGEGFTSGTSGKCKYPIMYLPDNFHFTFNGVLLLVLRRGGHSPPAGQCGDSALPRLWHDRRCGLLHQWTGVGRDASQRRGPGERHSSERWCPRRMESFEGESPVQS